MSLEVLKDFILAVLGLSFIDSENRSQIFPVRSSSPTSSRRRFSNLPPASVPVREEIERKRKLIDRLPAEEIELMAIRAAEALRFSLLREERSSDIRMALELMLVKAVNANLVSNNALSLDMRRSIIAWAENTKACNAVTFVAIRSGDNGDVRDICSSPEARAEIFRVCDIGEMAEILIRLFLGDTEDRFDEKATQSPPSSVAATAPVIIPRSSDVPNIAITDPSTPITRAPKTTRATPRAISGISSVQTAPKSSKPPAPPRSRRPAPPPSKPNTSSTSPKPARKSDPRPSLFPDVGRSSMPEIEVGKDDGSDSLIHLLRGMKLRLEGASHCARIRDVIELALREIFAPDTPRIPEQEQDLIELFLRNLEFRHGIERDRVEIIDAFLSAHRAHARP